MSKRKEIKTVRGFVVDHKTSGARYAVSPQNFNPKVHTKVRELEQHETVRGFQPKRREKSESRPQVEQAASQAPSSEGSQNKTK